MATDRHLANEMRQYRY